MSNLWHHMRGPNSAERGRKRRI